MALLQVRQDRLRSILFLLILSIPIFYLCTILNQDDGYKILWAYGLSFIGYGLLLSLTDLNSSWKFIIGFGVLLRLVLIFIFPNLSDDIYRFLWDGNLIQDGINPLSYKPSDFISQFPNADEQYKNLYPLLNSKDYYTVYPPVSQLVYWFSSLFESWSISAIVMKSILFLAELGTAYYLVKLLSKLGLPIGLVVWYFLNPLVIVEMTGQLHFEAIMIFFLVASIYFLSVRSLITSGSLLALSIGSKLLPLMFLPLIVRYVGDMKSVIKYLIAVGLTTVILFVPMFIGIDVTHFLSSINLYFQSFEFNASVYYLVRQMGYSLSGYNQIAIIGPALSLITVVTILLLGWRQKKSQLMQLLNAMLFSFSVYLFMTTTVHPWYLCMLVMFSIFQRSWWVLVWSGVVVWSYTTYITPEFIQDLRLISFEYIVVFIALLFQVFYTRKKNIQS